MQCLNRPYRLLSVLCLLLLGGCAGFKDESSCTKIDGLSSCTSMSDVNNMSESGYLSADEYGHAHRGYENGEKKGLTGNASKLTAKQKDQERVSRARPSSTPARIPERTVKMVVFPYLDEAQNYHDTATVTVLLTPAHWSKPAINHVRQQEEEE